MKRLKKKKKMIGGTNDYEGNNESARSLSKAYEQSGESERAPVVSSDNQNVLGHTVMFYEPMEMFERIPFNNSLKASKGEMSMY